MSKLQFVSGLLQHDYATLPLADSELCDMSLYSADIVRIDFVSGVTQAPILLDGVSAGVSVAALDYVRNSGLKDRVVYNSLLPEYKKEELEKTREVGIESAILLAFNTKEFTSQGRVEVIRELLPVATDAGTDKPLRDTAVIDIPSLGMACRAIHELRREFRLPIRSGAHNAIGTWKGLKKKMGRQAKDPSMAAACAITVASGVPTSFFMAL